MMNGKTLFFVLAATFSLATWAAAISGNVGAQNISTNTTWELADAVNINGTITIKNGAKLTITALAARTIKWTGSAYGDMFVLEGANSQLVITGAGDSARITIDGGITWSGSVNEYLQRGTTASGRSVRRVFNMLGGSISATYVTIQNIANQDYGGLGNDKTRQFVGSTTEGHWFNFGGGTAVTSVTMSHCTLQDIYGQMRMQPQGDIDVHPKATVKLSYLLIKGCHTACKTPLPHAAEIFVNIVDNATLEIDHMTAYNNLNTNVDLEEKSNGRGSVIYLHGGTMTLSDSTFSNNVCYYRGGAVYCQGTGTSSISNCEFKNNTAGGRGGALYLGAEEVGKGKTYNVFSATFTGNRAIPLDKKTSSYSGDGGAIAIAKSATANFGWTGGTVNINSNSSQLPSDPTFSFSCKGGGIYVEDSCTVNMGSNVHVERNTSATTGGGIYSTGSTINGVTAHVDNNTAVGNGGGIYMTKSDATFRYGGTFAGNESGANGGGIYATASVGSEKTLQFTNDGQPKISENSCVTNGGAIALNNMNFVLTGGTLQGNTAGNDNLDLGMGGAIYSKKSKMSISGGTFSGNQARQGGALAIEGPYVNGDTASMLSGGTITGNQACQGGGVYLRSGANLQMSGGKVVCNTATGTQSGTLTAYQYGTGRNVVGAGGGFYLASKSGDTTSTALNFAYNDVAVYNNTATMAGDDVVADGAKTMVNFAALAQMDMSGYTGYAEDWHEDYYTGDPNYAYGLHSGAGAYRNREHPELTGLAWSTTNYVCATLGYSFPISLWITDHADAGSGKVHLQFEPTIVAITSSLPEWASQMDAAGRLKVAWGKDETELQTNIDNGTYTPATLRAGTFPAADRRVWITADVPANPKDLRYCKIVIPGAATPQN